MNKHTVGCAIMLTLAAQQIDAAEWTRTIDLIRPSSEVRVLEADLGADANAFWIGTALALDPSTGATLNPATLPERLWPKRSGTQTSLISSHRGTLWTRDSGRFTTDYEADAAGALWALPYRFGLTQHVELLASDGAQSTLLDAAALGQPGRCVRSLSASRTRAGAWVLLGSCEVFGAEPRVLELDARARVVAEHAVPGCATEVYDDRNGGFYARCPETAFVGASLVRVARDPAQSWTAPQVLGATPRPHVFTDGGVLVHEVRYEGDDLWHRLDGRGQRQFTFAAEAAAASETAIWSWSDEQKRLTRRDRSGQTQAITPLNERVRAIVAHAQGSALVHVDAVPTSNDEDELRLYSPQAELRYTTRFREVVGTTRSGIRFNGGQPLLDTLDDRTAALIDDQGEINSASVPINIIPIAYYRRVRADATSVCVETIGGFLMSSSQFRCFGRNSGLPIGPRDVVTSFANDFHLGAQVLVVDDTRAYFFRRNGFQLLEIGLPAAGSFASDSRAGLAVLNTSAPFMLLTRYGMDGRIAMQANVDSIEAAQLLLSANGAVLLRNAHGTRLDHYAPNGALRGRTSIADVLVEYELVDAESFDTGVQLLFRQRGEGRFRSGMVMQLAPDLSGRTQYSLPPAPDNINSPVLLSAEAFSHALWPAEQGPPRVASVSGAGLVVERFGANGSASLDRRVLPLANAANFVLNFPAAYAIDAAGTVRLFERDAALDRDLLRISEATPAFTGPVRQQAFAGSWYAPSATGQGLIVNLMNDASQLFAAWHTYAPEGGNSLAKQQWLTVQGDVGNQRGAITLPIYRNRDGRFDVVGRTDAEAVGEAELVFTGCDRMEFWYRLGDERGALPLQRLTPRTLPCDNGTRIEAAADAPSGIDVSGPWYDPSRSGQGLAVSASGARFNQFLAGWFSYDADGANDDPDAQHWFTVQGPNPARYGEAVIATIYRTIGGSRSGQPTRNTHKVGSAELTVHDCGHATLEYVFDDSALAGAFANKSRALPLTRLGRCPD